MNTILIPEREIYAEYTSATKKLAEKLSGNSFNFGTFHFVTVVNSNELAYVIEGKDKATGDFYTLASGNITTSTRTIVKVGPGETTYPLPEEWRVRVTPDDAVGLTVACQAELEYVQQQVNTAMTPFITVTDSDAVSAEVTDINFPDSWVTDNEDGTVDVAMPAAQVDLIGYATVAVTNTPTTPDGVAHIAIQVKDAEGASVAARRLLKVWFAETAYAAPADLGTLTASTGVILKEDTDDALATIVTDANGAAVLALDLAVDGTVHCMVAVGANCATANAAITGNA